MKLMKYLKYIDEPPNFYKVIVFVFFNEKFRLARFYNVEYKS